MKTLSMIAATALLGVLAAAPGYAQQPAPPPDPHHPDASKGTSTLAPTPGPPGASMPMDMCRQMMSDMMATPMTGGATSADPKEKADMLQMRGEMMKAMGDIMMKHARRMQGATTGK